MRVTFAHLELTPKHVRTRLSKPCSEMRSFVIGVALLGLARSAPATEGIIEHAWKINVRSVHWLGSRLASWSIDPTRCCPSTPYVPTLVLSHVYLLNIEANSSFPHFILSRFAYCHQSSSNRTVYWAGEKLPSPVASLSLSLCSIPLGLLSAMQKQMQLRFDISPSPQSIAHTTNSIEGP